MPGINGRMTWIEAGHREVPTRSMLLNISPPDGADSNRLLAACSVRLRVSGALRRRSKPPVDSPSSRLPYHLPAGS